MRRRRNECCVWRERTWWQVQNNININKRVYGAYKCKSEQYCGIQNNVLRFYLGLLKEKWTFYNTRSEKCKIWLIYWKREVAERIIYQLVTSITWLLLLRQNIWLLLSCLELFYLFCRLHKKNPMCISLASPRCWYFVLLDFSWQLMEGDKTAQGSMRDSPGGLLSADLNNLL